MDGCIASDSCQLQLTSLWKSSGCDGIVGLRLEGARSAAYTVEYRRSRWRCLVPITRSLEKAQEPHAGDRSLAVASHVVTRGTQARVVTAAEWDRGQTEQKSRRTEEQLYQRGFGIQREGEREGREEKESLQGEATR